MFRWFEDNWWAYIIVGGLLISAIFFALEVDRQYHKDLLEKCGCKCLQEVL